MSRLQAAHAADALLLSASPLAASLRQGSGAGFPWCILDAAAAVSQRTQAWLKPDKNTTSAERHGLCALLLEWGPLE